MRLIRHGEPGQEKPGMIDGLGVARDLSGCIHDIDGRTLRPQQLSQLSRIDPKSLPVVPNDVRRAAPVANPSKIICIGLNYADHARETGLPVPEKPVIFLKAPSALSGPFDAIKRPNDSSCLDWEAELAVIIGTSAKTTSEAEALSLVAGYAVMNDVSERSFSEEHGGQWTKGKSADTFAPLGPCLVTADEIPDPQKLRITLEVSGQRYQDSSTAEMIQPVAQLITYITRFMSLEAGDLIATGTPAGVGLGHKPPVYLKDGDRVTASIEQIGAIENVVVGNRGSREPSVAGQRT